MADTIKIKKPVKVFMYFLALFFLCCIQAALAGQAALRNVIWGMSRFDVMASEDLSPETYDAYYVHYKPEIQGREQDLIYGFFDNYLVDAVYVITVLKPDEHMAFRKNLEKKYGKPVSVEERKERYLFVWENKETRIVMRPGRLKECRIEYISKKYKYLKDREAREVLEREEKERFWTY
jgi:hypothetical protein